MKNPFYSLLSGYWSKFFRKTGSESISAILNADPIWIDLGDAWRVFRSIPHLNLVLNQKATFVSQAEITVVDLEGNIVDTPTSREAMKIIHAPNPLQSKAEFLYQYSINRNLMGTAFIYKFKGLPSQSIPNNMWVIPSDAIEILTTGKLYQQSDIEGIIKGYNLIKTSNKEMTFSTDEILLKNQGNTSDVIVGEQPLESLRKSISNIAFGMGMVNVVYSKKGAIGILSGGASRDSTGAIPLGEKERQRISEQYLNDYGTDGDKLSVIVTNATMNWSPMSYPLKDLIIHEEIEQDFGHICDRFGVDRDIFSSTKGATFENQKQAEITTIQGSVTQEIDDLMMSLSIDFGLIDEGLRFKASYDHLAVFQEDMRSKEEANRLKLDNLFKQWTEGLLTRNDIRRAQSLEEIDDPEMNRFIWQSVDRGDEEIAPDQQAIIEAQASLRGSVGGVNGIIGTIGAIARGEMTPEQAVNVFMEIYGFSQDVSERIAGLKGLEERMEILKVVTGLTDDELNQKYKVINNEQ